MFNIGESLTSPNNTFRFRQFLPQYLSCPPDYFLLRLEVSKQSVQPKTYKYWQQANVIVKAKRNRVNARIELRLTCQAGYMQMAVGCQMQIIAKKHIIAHKRHTDCRLLPTGDIHCIALEEAACCKGADNSSRVQEYQIWIKQILCQDSLHTNGWRTFAPTRSPRTSTSVDIGSSSPPGPSLPPRH